VNDAGLWGILDDLHNPFYEEITASQAQQVASDLGALTNKTTLQPLAA
jgi:hypothetical protein